jgi:hypothetical protein
VILIKLSSTSAADESSTFIHFDYDFDYLLDILKELIQLSVAQYEMKRVYSDSRIFHKFAKETVITVRADRLIEKQLTVTKAIENARKLRVNQSKKFIQKEDVIRVKDCRRMISDRKDEEDRLKQEREMRVMRQQRKR